MKRLLLSLSLLCLPLGAQAENKISGSRQKWVKVYQKQGQWNRITIQAKGDTVKTWLNGNPAAHWTNSEYLRVSSVCRFIPGKPERFISATSR